jgi:hypothetical protein
VTTADVASSSVRSNKIVYSSGEVNSRFLKKDTASGAILPPPEKPQTGIQKIMEIAANLKYEENALGELREMKNEILSLPSQGSYRLIKTNDEPKFIMKNIIASLFFCLPVFMMAQVNRPDTVVVELARTSKLVFTMQDSTDLFQLKHYDFEALFQDILAKLENQNQDTSKVAPAEEPSTSSNDEDDEDDDAVTERPSYKDYEG